MTKISISANFPLPNFMALNVKIDEKGELNHKIWTIKYLFLPQGGIVAFYIVRTSTQYEKMTGNAATKVINNLYESLVKCFVSTLEKLTPRKTERFSGCLFPGGHLSARCIFESKL